MSERTMIGRSRPPLPLLRLFSAVLIFSLLLLPAGALAAPETSPSSVPWRASLSSLHRMVCVPT